ncbi:MAG: AmmeMemoRadiSam system radical SAM enzyme [Desulfosarcina sp.]|nr:AmmeMemoRadiSam system radical SAM enzyme [Desulfobacterales bacterium]
MAINRRRFLYCSSVALCGSTCFGAPLSLAGQGGADAGSADIRGQVFRGDAPARLWKWSREGFLYRRLEDDQVQCLICPNRCILAPGDRSVCRSRVNLGGKLYTLAYGNPCAVHNDPVEKKPLYHFLPQSKVLSLATTGCNFRCLNCQNWEISQARPEAVRFLELFPAEAVRKAAEIGSVAMAYTYSEAITYYEYMIDTARLARARGIKNLLISNGYINREPLETLCDVLDGANINLKSFSNAVYRQLNGGTLQPVLETLKTLHRRGVHLEITTLVVPGYVDDEAMIQAMCGWIREHLGPDHPLHFTRFVPHYKLNRLPPTPVSTLERCRAMALEAGLHYVYVGNVPLHDANHTYCHQCGKRVVERLGYHIPSFHLKDGCCEFCGTAIPGRWDA